MERRRLSTARAHGGVAGHPYAEDEGRRLFVAPHVSVHDDSSFRYEVEITSSHDPESRTVYLEVDAPFAVAPPSLADAALLIGLFPGMCHGGELHVAGRVSAQLVRNVRILQSIWLQARPDLFSPFRLVAEEVVDDVAPVSERGIMPLSGGLDSLLALTVHTDPDRPLGTSTCDLGACLFIPGLSPHLDRSDEFPEAIAKVREIAAVRGLPLAVAETNYTNVVPYLHWSHGALLAAALTLFSSRFGIGLIASSVPYLYRRYRFWGSIAWGDPFFSSGAMAIREHGGDMTRDEKTSALCHYPDMLDHLMVCFHVEGQNANCCRCEKCTRTMLNFLAIGEAIPEKAFPGGLDPIRIGKRVGRHTPWAYAEATLRATRAAGTKHPALSRLRRMYIWKRAKWEARHLLTRIIPRLNLLRRDAWVPIWMAQRNAQAAAKRPRGPWYEPVEF